LDLFAARTVEPEDAEDTDPVTAPAEQGAWGNLTRRLRRPSGSGAERQDDDPPVAAAASGEPGAWEALTGTINTVDADVPETPVAPREAEEVVLEAVAAPKPAAPEPGAPEPAAPELDAPESATDPGAWKALAKTLRRNALGDEAEDEEDEEPEEPAAPMTEDDRSDLRARLAKASAKKRRKPD
jgi:hypothetical protein